MLRKILTVLTLAFLLATGAIAFSAGRALAAPRTPAVTATSASALPWWIVRLQRHPRVHKCHLVRCAVRPPVTATPR